MANTRRYSPAGTQYNTGSFTASTVYSQTGDGSNDGGCPRGAYNSITSEGMQEGVSAPVYKPRTDPTTSASEVAALDGITQSADLSADGVPASTAVICGTPALTGNGAGLIVEFDTTNATTPQNHASTYTIVDAGVGYADNDTVEIVGFPGSILTVNGVG